MKAAKKMFFFLMFLMVPSFSQNKIVSRSLSLQELKNGISLFNERRYPTAIQAFERALAYEPQNFAAKYRLGLAYLHAGYAQNAIQVWEDLVHQGVADHHVLQRLNNLYFLVSMDKGYQYDDPYVFREFFDGFTEAGHALIRPSFIAYDKYKDLKFVSSAATGLVLEIDSANTIKQKYGSRFFRSSLLKMPMGLILLDNLLFVADFKQDKIFVFNRNLTGTQAWNFGKTGIEPGQLSGPMGMMLGPDEYLYIVENGNGRIQKMSTNGTSISIFGEDILFRPTDIELMGDKIFVSDISHSGEGRIVVFDLDGNFESTFGEAFLSEPRGLFRDGQILYISDAKNGLFLYNIEHQTATSFSVQDDKLGYPFDLLKDKDSIIVRTDFNSQMLGIYSPLQGIYGNLSIDIPQIITENYPYIYALLRVRNKDGTPLTGITSEELTVKEFDTTLSKPILQGTTKFRSNMLISFIIDRSKSMDPYMPQLEYYIKTFLSNMSGDDLLDIKIVDDRTYTVPRQKASIGVPWYTITNHQTQDKFSQDFDIAIYDSITSLLNNLRNRAIVVFTSGEGGNQTFETYGSDILKTYADQNSIPIYVVNFSSGNQSFWENLTEGSHGKYFNARTQANQILNLYSQIKDSPPLEYLVEFSSLDYRKNPGVWVDLSLALNRSGVSGIALGGYFVPIQTKKSLSTNDLFR